MMCSPTPITKEFTCGKQNEEPTSASEVSVACGGQVGDHQYEVYIIATVVWFGVAVLAGAFRLSL